MTCLFWDDITRVRQTSNDIINFSIRLQRSSLEHSPVCKNYQTSFWWIINKLNFWQFASLILMRIQLQIDKSGKNSIVEQGQLLFQLNLKFSYFHFSLTSFGPGFASQRIWLLSSEQCSQKKIVYLNVEPHKSKPKIFFNEFPRRKKNVVNDFKRISFSYKKIRKR